jgi:hypothetical protein
MGRLAQVWLAVGLLLWPAAANAAEIVWTVSKKNGRAYLNGMPNESEVETTSFGCIAGGTARSTSAPRPRAMSARVAARP